MLTLSGFEGVGKSTIIEELVKYSGDYRYTESARYFIPLESNLFKDSKDVISLKCLLSDINILRFYLENNIHNVILDRNLIDALCYIDIYYPEIKIDHDLLAEHLYRLCEENNVSHIHKTSVLVKHPKNKKHVMRIISDPIRKYNSTVEQYILGAKKWEEKYLEFNDKLEMICENFMIINAYPDELNGVEKIIKVHYEE